MHGQRCFFYTPDLSVRANNLTHSIAASFHTWVMNRVALSIRGLGRVDSGLRWFTTVSTRRLAQTVPHITGNLCNVMLKCAAPVKRQKKSRRSNPGGFLFKLNAYVCYLHVSCRNPWRCCEIMAQQFFYKVNAHRHGGRYGGKQASFYRKMCGR
jgi:hypothetical protein